MVMIRRELPRTNIASPAVSLSHRVAEDSPACVPRLRLALSWMKLTVFIGYAVFVFSFSGRFLLLFLLLLFVGHAATDWLGAFSVFTAMAQMKPSSSRPTAVAILR